MRIPSNKIADIISFFRKEMKDIYDEEELTNIIWLSFNHVIGYSKTDLQLNKNSNVNQSDLLKLYFIIKDLKRNKPIQYVLGETEFCGSRFLVSEHVLIPRPETEELVHLVANYVKKNLHKNVSILDIGTGSGCIPVSIKKLLPSSIITAADISEDALNVARKNAKLNAVEVEFVNADILNAEKIGGKKFDVIVSNPPYISTQEKHTLDKRVTDFEPHLALFASENDPLIFYKAILDFANRNKTPHIFFELNAELAGAVNQTAAEKGFRGELIMDIYGKQRFLHAYK